MISLLQLFCRKVAKPRIRLRASEVRNRASSRTHLVAQGRPFEAHDPVSRSAMVFASHHRRRRNAGRE